MELSLTGASTSSLVVRGVVAILFGIFALVWPSITLHVILILFALYALVAGAAAAITAVVDRQDNDAWPLGLIFGTIAVLIGIYLLARPGLTALVILYLIALYAIVVGVIDVVSGVALRRSMRGEWVLVIVGILSLLLGLYLFANPGVGVLSLVWLIAVYALVTGVFWLVAAASHDTARRRVGRARPAAAVASTARSSRSR